MDDLIQNPVVPVTHQPEAEPAPSAPQVEGTEAETGETETPVEKTFTQKELDEILAKKTAKLLRQREQERAKRELYEQQLQKIAPPQVQTPGKPHISQFADAEQYAEAVAEWKLQQKAAEDQARQAQSKQSEFVNKRDDFLAELQDTDGFDMRKFNALPISIPMAEAILDSDISTKLALHLTHNPDEAQRIAALSPARQAAEIGKLELKLSAASKKPSNAPAPINPVSGSGSTVTSDIYDKRLANDTKAWIAARNAQLKARR